MDQRKNLSSVQLVSALRSSFKLGRTELSQSKKMELKSLSAGSNCHCPVRWNNPKSLKTEFQKTRG